MNVWLASLIGFILGLVVMWIFDRFFNNKGQMERNREEVRVQLRSLKNENKELRQSLDQKQQVVMKEKDDLQKINGIGPAFAKRFNEADVHTFADLAALTPDRAREIINPKEWQAIQPESWIAEAKERSAVIA